MWGREVQGKVRGGLGGLPGFQENTPEILFMKLNGGAGECTG